MNKQTLIFFGLVLIASVLCAILVTKSCVKPDVVQPKPDDSRFKRREDSIRLIQMRAQDSIEALNEVIKTHSTTIHTNHQNLRHDIHTISTYTDRNKLMDSLLGATGH